MDRTGHQYHREGSSTLSETPNHHRLAETQRVLHQAWRVAVVCRIHHPPPFTLGLGRAACVGDAKLGLSDYLDRWYRCKRPVDEQRKVIVEAAASPSMLRKTPEDSVFKQ
ncbi:hypothetical protein CDV31_016773 [Fusarium ambrosium]|uniref:Uncharacterized protein n=1 Tax=Fusarium ambrosium TaxID=131363 RepID=A0A428S2J4_9HYPO|nr:hypothetical protein CDV31_016773 [Fusarium ambrosium]